MRLTVKDRLKISDILPREANIMTQSVVREIIAKVTITQDEQKVYGMASTPNGWSWDSTKAQDKDVEFSAVELGVLKAGVEKIDKENQVTLDLLDLCIKIRDAKSA